MDLPLKNSEMKFISNKAQVLRRIESQKRRLENNPTLKADYTEFMRDMVENNYAEKVEQAQDPPDRTWYINHYVVYHPTKHKIRVVFNCSEKFKGLSLNDVLLQGPDLTNNLIGVLTRFREHEVGVQGDIRGMFHQVKVAEKDRDLLTCSK